MNRSASIPRIKSLYCSSTLHTSQLSIEAITNYKWNPATASSQTEKCDAPTENCTAHHLSVYDSISRFTKWAPSQTSPIIDDYLSWSWWWRGHIYMVNWNYLGMSWRRIIPVLWWKPSIDLRISLLRRGLIIASISNNRIGIMIHQFCLTILNIFFLNNAVRSFIRCKISWRIRQRTIFLHLL